MTIFKFKDFEFDSVPGILTQNGEPVKLRPQTARALSFMLQNPGELVSREALVNYVWGEQIVNDQAVFQAINQLRKALGDSASEPTYLKTVPRRGYKWICPLENDSVAEPAPEVPLSSLDHQDQPLNVETQTAAEAEENKSLETEPEKKAALRPFILVLAFIVLSLGIAYVLNSGSNAKTAGSEADQAVNERTRIAFLPFQNITGEDTFQWIELGLMDMVVRAFGNQPTAGPIPTERVLEAYRELGLMRGVTVDRIKRERLRDSLGADWVITVAISKKQEAFVLDYEALNREGQLRKNEMSGTDLSDLATRMAGDLSFLFQMGRGLPAEAFSKDSFVNETYGLGVAELGKGFEAKAIPYFEVCIKKDPSFLWAGYQLAHAYHNVGRHEEAHKLARKYQDLARKAKNKDLLANVTELLADWSYAAQEDKVSEELYLEALSLYKELGDKENLAHVHMSLGELYKEMGFPEKAWTEFEKALDQLRSVSNRLSAAPVYGILGLAYLDEGRTREANRYLKEEMGIYESLESWTDAAVARFNLGSWYYFENQPENARKALKESLVYAKRSEHRATGMLAHLRLADLDLEVEDWNAAQANLDQALEWAIQMENPQDQLTVKLALLKVAAYSGDEILLNSIGKSVLDLAESLNDAYSKVLAWSYYGDYYLSKRNLEAGKTYLDLVWDNSPQKGPICLLLKARYLFETGNAKDAHRLQQGVKDEWPTIWDPREEALLKRYAEALR